MLLNTIGSSQDPLGLGSTSSGQKPNASWFVAVHSSKAHTVKHLMVLLGLARHTSLAEHPCNGLLIDHIELNSPGQGDFTQQLMHCGHKNDNFTSIWLPQGRIVDLEVWRKHEARKKLLHGPFLPCDEKWKTAKSLPVITS